MSAPSLFEVEQRLKVLEHLPGHVVVLDNDCRILEINRVANGYKKSDLIGRIQWECVGTIEGSRITRENWIRFSETGEEGTWFDTPGLPVGTWFRMTYTRMDSNTIICSAIEVTGEKQYARELLERNAALARSNEDLSHFAYAASHDFQEPLRTITSYLNIVLEEIEPHIRGEVVEYIEFINQAVSRMKDLIESLLRYARVESQGEPMVRVDLNQKVLEIAETLRDLPVNFEVGELPEVIGDPAQIWQLFNNLFTNSIRYRKPRSTSKIKVLHVGSKDGFHEISVQDDGIGIEPEYREMVFQLFKRLHTRQEHEGTGIGLAMVRRILERHGGRVWITSPDGGGADFHFTLPASS